MVTRISTLNRLLKHIPKISISPRHYYSNLKMAKAFIRCVDKEDTLGISFIYADDKYGIKERQYNFNRVQTEPLEATKTRIIESIKRQADKKRKKMKRKLAVQAESQHLEEFQLEVNVFNEGNLCNGDLSCKDSFVNGAQLRIGGTIYDVVVNPPTIKTLTLPTNIMAGFPVHPKVEVEFVEKKDCDYVWYRSTNVVIPSEATEGSSNATTKNPVPQVHPVKNWEQVGTGFYYQISMRDIGRKLRLVCTPKSANGNVGQTVEVCSSVAVSAGPGPCPFDTRHEMTKSSAGFGRFRFVSYNILADLYADSDFSRESLFPYCPPYALSIDYRKQLLLKEIIGYNADIVCLQEVDKKVFENDLQPSMESLGWTGVFNLKGGQVVEGLACFFRESKFRLVDSSSIILADAIQNSPVFMDFLEAINQNHKLKERLLQRTTALQVVVLESVEVPKQYLCIGNNHLYFHPDADHIRLLQAGMTLLHIEQVVALTKSKNPESNVAVVVCGDFNSTPEFGVYQLMTMQFIPDDYADWSSNESEAVKNLTLSHPFQLESACGTPPYTNFTPGFSGCLDYIYIDKSQINVEEVIPLPSDEEVKEHTAIPSVTFPSDHMALVCNLSWKNATSK